MLSYIREVNKDIEKNLPFVRQITALTNMEYVDVKNGDLYIDDLIREEIPSDREELNIIKQKVLAKNFYINRIITPDAKKTGIFIEFDPFPEEIYYKTEKVSNNVILKPQIYLENELDNKEGYQKNVAPRSLVTPTLQFILNRHKNDEVKITAIGWPITEYKLEQDIQRDSTKTFFLALITSIIFLIILFRSIICVIAPVIIIFATTIITFGLIGWLSIPISTFAVIIALLLLVLAMSYSIHVINHFRRFFRQTGQRKESLHYTFQNATWPCFITAATTAVAFISFTAVPITQIKNMGIVAAIGCFVTYSLVMILIPCFFSFGKDKKILQNKEQINKSISKDKYDKLMINWANISLTNAPKKVLVSAVIMAICIFFIFNIKVDNDAIDMFGDGCEFVRDAKHVTKYIGGLASYEIFIELPEEGMSKEPKVLHALDRLDSLIALKEFTKLTTSVNNIIKDVNMSMNNNDKYFYKIPQSRELIAQYLLLYTMSGGEELSKWIDYSDKFLRLSVQVEKSTILLKSTFDKIESFVKANFPEGTHVTITGQMPMFIKSVDALIKGQILAILIAYVGILLMMSLILRSIPVGLVFMIPNILPVGIVSGFMGLVGFTLNMQTIIVAPLLMGIVVDDTIHYFIHFKREFDKYRNYTQANRETFRKIGWALVYTSIILIFGFSSFFVSSIQSVIQIAVLFSLGILIALVADMLLTPSLCVLFKVFGPEIKK